MRVGIVTKTRHDLGFGPGGHWERRPDGGLERGPNGGTFRRRRKVEDVDERGVRWVCAIARADREFRVADDLASIGFRVFCPHGVKVSHHARLPNGRRGLSSRDIPVFGRYLFVGEPGGLMVAQRSHPDLVGVLLDGDRPARVPARFVRVAADLWLAGQWDDRCRKPAPGFRRGDVLRIKEGPFAGLNGEVERLPDALRAVLRVTMFGAKRNVTIDARDLEML